MRLPALILALLASCLPLGAQAQALPDAPAMAQLEPVFLAFFPLYEMARLRYVSVEAAANPRRQDVNQFNHLRRLLDHTDRTVTAPNNDTLYSSARLDLSRGPLLIETPAIPGRYYSLQFMNAYTDNLAVLGRRTHGDGPLRIAVVGPQWNGPLPAHTQRLQSDTNDLWLLIRTLVDGPQDIAAVAALQEQYRITAPEPASAYPRQRRAPPAQPTPAQFLSVVNEFLGRNPPQGRMATIATGARALGIAPGQPEAWAALAEPVRQAWTTHWEALRARLLQPTTLQSRVIGGWEFPPPGVGTWGDNDLLRATVALRGIAALDLAETQYLAANADAEGRPLDGAARYRLRIPPGGLPVQGFWSLTMYEALPDGRYFLVDNPIRRYSVGNRTQGLKANPDGSIDILMQRDAPVDTTNWLPAPAGRFRLSLRAYLPQADFAQGRGPLPQLERLP